MAAKKRKDNLIQISAYFSQEMLDWMDSHTEELGDISRNSLLNMAMAKYRKEIDAQKKKDDKDTDDSKI